MIEAILEDDGFLMEILEYLGQIIVQDRARHHASDLFPSQRERAQTEYLGSATQYQQAALEHQRRVLEEQSRAAYRRQDHERELAAQRAVVEHQNALHHNALARWPVLSVPPGAALDVSKSCEGKALSVFVSVAGSLALAEAKTDRETLWLGMSEADQLLKRCRSDSASLVSLYFEINRVNATAGDGSMHTIWHFLKTEPCLVIECGLRDKRFWARSCLWTGTDTVRPPCNLTDVEFAVGEEAGDPNRMRETIALVLSLLIGAYADRHQTHTATPTPTASLISRLLKQTAPGDAKLLEFGTEQMLLNGLELANPYPLLGVSYLAELARHLHSMNHEMLSKRVAASIVKTLDPTFPKEGTPLTWEGLVEFTARLPPAEASTGLLIALLEAMGVSDKHKIVSRRREVVAASNPADLVAGIRKYSGHTK